MTSEELHAHAAALPPAPTIPPGTATAVDVCNIYQKIRPVLVMLEGFIFIPANLRAWITAFTGVLDSFCPAGGQNPVG